MIETNFKNNLCLKGNMIKLLVTCFVPTLEISSLWWSCLLNMYNF